MSTRHVTIALSVVFAFLAIAGFLSPSAPSAQAQRPGAPALEDKCFREAGARASIHRTTGRLGFLGTQPGRAIRQPAALPALASPEIAARSYLAQCGSLFGLRDAGAELQVERTRSFEGGRSAVRFQQVFQGIPVLAGELIVQVDGPGNIIAVVGEILPGISLNPEPTLNRATAQAAARQAVARKYQVKPEQLVSTQPELWIYNPALLSPGSGPTSLVWRLEVASEHAAVRELVLIHAQRGSVELNFNQVDSIKNRETYTANNGTTLPGVLICNESNPNCTGGDAHAASAHLFAGDTYDFYENYHGRNSIDNAGMTIRTTVHYDIGSIRAEWNGSQMVFGDAYGFALADDVVAHELTHGVTQYESNLFNYYQSGAINESFSDLWGEFVDQTNGHGTDTPEVRWLIGEDISGNGALRNMQYPPQFQQPDKMTSTLYKAGTCADYGDNCDDGWVHTNSGVNNKAAFLMTDGGTFNGYTVVGLGIAKVAKIYYQVQTTMLTSGSDYADLFDILEQSCLNLVGTSGITTGDCDQVRKATLAVEMNQQPVARYNPEAPICTSGVPQNVYFEDFEDGASAWTFGALAGTSRWGYDSPYGPFAHSGSHFLYADDWPGEVSDSFAAMNASVALPPNALLHFSHAYGFDDAAGTYYDGGIVEYSTDGGASWRDAGTLFDYNGYSGTLASGYASPLPGRPAFVADSHGYVSSRVNLNSLAGQSVRFRWRMALDNSVFDQGWWLDDVRIYTCVNAPGPFSKTGPPNGAIGLPTNPTLSWGNSAQAAAYQYCVDETNDNTCDAAWNWVGVKTNVTLSGLKGSTTYYWQVFAVNAAGLTDSNGGTWWSFTTQVEPPAGFSKTGPANGAINTATSPTLSWIPSFGATGYEYCYDETPGNSCDTGWMSVGTNTSAAVSGLGYGKIYYWQARASNSVGTTEANGGTWWSFTTAPPPPGAFGKQDPSDGARDQPTNPTLSWNSAPGAAGYEYCYQSLNDGACRTHWNDVGPNTTANLTGLFGSTVYYWQVRAKNAGGTTEADGGSWWRFTTKQAIPGPFGKSSPANGASDLPTNLSLNWEWSNGATDYEYCYDTTNDNNCSSNWTSTGAQAGATLTGLQSGMSYYWQVRAVNPVGSTEADGGIWWTLNTQPASQTVEESNLAIQYNGWRGVKDTKANGGGYRVSRVYNDKLTFRFSGTSVTWLTIKDSDQGKAQVIIDGVLKENVNLYSPTRRWNVPLSYGKLSNTSHKLTIKVLGTKDSASYDTNVSVDAFAVGAAATQEDSCKIGYNTWTCAPQRAASGGSYRYSSAKGATASLTFTGSALEWITANGANYGKAEVRIDYFAPFVLDLYGPTTWQVARPLTGFGLGTHTVQIKVLGLHRGASTGNRVALDAFRGAVTLMATDAPAVPDQSAEELAE